MAENELYLELPEKERKFADRFWHAAARRTCQLKVSKDTHCLRRFCTDRSFLLRPLTFVQPEVATIVADPVDIRISSPGEVISLHITGDTVAQEEPNWSELFVSNDSFFLKENPPIPVSTPSQVTVTAEPQPSTSYESKIIQSSSFETTKDVFMPTDEEIMFEESIVEEPYQDYVIDENYMDMESAPMFDEPRDSIATDNQDIPSTSESVPGTSMKINDKLQVEESSALELEKLSLRQEEPVEKHEKKEKRQTRTPRKYEEFKVPEIPKPVKSRKKSTSSERPKEPKIQPEVRPSTSTMKPPAPKTRSKQPLTYNDLFGKLPTRRKSETSEMPRPRDRSSSKERTPPKKEDKRARLLEKRNEGRKEDIRKEEKRKAYATEKEVEKTRIYEEPQSVLDSSKRRSHRKKEISSSIPTPESIQIKPTENSEQTRRKSSRRAIESKPEDEDIIVLSPPRQNRKSPEVIVISSLSPPRKYEIEPTAERPPEVKTESVEIIDDEDLEIIEMNEEEEDSILVSPPSASDILVEMCDFIKADSIEEDSFPFPPETAKIDPSIFLDFLKALASWTSRNFMFDRLSEPTNRFGQYREAEFIKFLVDLSTSPNIEQNSDSPVSTIMTNFTIKLSVAATQLLTSSGNLNKRRCGVTSTKLSSLLSNFKRRAKDLWDAMAGSILKKIDAGTSNATKFIWNEVMNSLFNCVVHTLHQMASASSSRPDAKESVLRRRFEILLFGWRSFLLQGGQICFFLAKTGGSLDPNIAQNLKNWLGRHDILLKVMKEELSKGKAERTREFALRHMSAYGWDALNEAVSLVDNGANTYCSTCQLYFTSEDIIKMHKFAHESNDHFCCDTCFVDFNHRLSLAIHVLDRHADSILTENVNV